MVENITLENCGNTNCVLIFSSEIHVKYIENLLYHIKDLLKEKGFYPQRLDDTIKSGENYITKIVELIKKSILSVIILDGLRPNVTLEMGISLAFGIDVIVIMCEYAEISVKTLYKDCNEANLSKLKFDNLTNPKLDIDKHLSDYTGNHILKINCNHPSEIRKKFSNELENIIDLLKRKRINSQETDEQEKAEFKAIYLTKKAKIDEISNNLNDSLISFEEANKIYESIGKKSEIASNLSNIAYIYKNTGKLRKSLEYFLKSYEIYEQLNDLTGMAPIHGAMGQIYAKSGETQKALEHYQKSFEFYRQLNELKGMAPILVGIGKIYVDTDELQKALEYYQKSYEIYQQLDDLKGIVVNFMSMGQIYTKTGELAKALDYYKKSYEIYRQLNDMEGMALNLEGMGQIYANTDESQKALEYYQKSYEIYERSDDLEKMVIILGTMGQIYEYTGEPQKALKLFQKCLELSSEINYTEGIKFARTMIEKFKERN